MPHRQNIETYSGKLDSCLSFWKSAGDPTAGLSRKKLHRGSWKLVISATNQLHQRGREEGEDTEEAPPRTARQGWAALGPGWTRTRTRRALHTPGAPQEAFVQQMGWFKSVRSQNRSRSWEVIEKVRKSWQLHWEKDPWIRRKKKRFLRRWL